MLPPALSLFAAQSFAARIFQTCVYAFVLRRGADADKQERERERDERVRHSVNGNGGFALWPFSVRDGKNIH